MRTRYLTVMLFIAALAAETRINGRLMSIVSRPGRRITRTPIKPTATADHRRSRTSSCRIKAAPIVAKRGAVKLTAVAVASGTSVIP